MYCRFLSGGVATSGLQCELPLLYAMWLASGVFPKLEGSMDDSRHVTSRKDINEWCKKKKRPKGVMSVKLKIASENRVEIRSIAEIAALGLTIPGLYFLKLKYPN